MTEAGLSITTEDLKLIPGSDAPLSQSTDYRIFLEDYLQEVLKMLERACQDAARLPAVEEKYRRLRQELKPEGGNVRQNLKYLRLLLPEDHNNTVLSVYDSEEVSESIREVTEAAVSMDPEFIRTATPNAIQLVNEKEDCVEIASTALRRVQSQNDAEAVSRTCETLLNTDCGAAVQPIAALLNTIIPLAEMCTHVVETVDHFRGNEGAMQSSLSALKQLISGSQELHQDPVNAYNQVRETIKISPETTHQVLTLFGETRSSGYPHAIPLCQSLLSTTTKDNIEELKPMLNGLASNIVNGFSALVSDFFLSESGLPQGEKVKFSACFLEQIEVSRPVVPRVLEFYRDSAPLSAICNEFLKIYKSLCRYSSGERWLKYLDVLSEVDSKYITEVSQGIDTIYGTITQTPPEESLQLVDSTIMRTVRMQYSQGLQSRFPAFRLFKETLEQFPWGETIIDWVEEQLGAAESLTEAEESLLTRAMEMIELWENVAKLGKEKANELIFILRIQNDSEFIAKLRTIVEIVPYLTVSAVKCIQSRISDIENLVLFAENFLSLAENGLIAPLVSSFFEGDDYERFIGHFDEEKVYLSLAQLAYQFSNLPQRLEALSAVSSAQFLTSLATIDGGGAVLVLLQLLAQAEKRADRELFLYANCLVAKIKETREWLEATKIVHPDYLPAVVDAQMELKFSAASLQLTKLVAVRQRDALEFLSESKALIAAYNAEEVVTVFARRLTESASDSPLFSSFSWLVRTVTEAKVNSDTATIEAVDYIIKISPVLPKVLNVSSAERVIFLLELLLTAPSVPKADCITLISCLSPEIRLERVREVLQNSAEKLKELLQTLWKCGESGAAIIQDVLEKLQEARLQLLIDYGKALRNSGEHAAALVHFGRQLCYYLDSGNQECIELLNDLCANGSLLIQVVAESGGDLNAIVDKFVREKCILCEHFFLKTEETELDCGDKLHFLCLRAHCDSNAMTGRVQCPVCQKRISAEKYRDLMSPDVYASYLAVHVVERGSLKLKCPRCEGETHREKLEIGEEAKIDCEKCSFSFCGITGTEWISPHDYDRCRFDFVQNMIAELETTFGGADKISQCPHCYSVNVWDDSDAVICPYCRTNYCFRCSALRGPIMAHHNTWHRPQCAHYIPTRRLEKEPMEQRCPECQRLGTRCNPPQDLRVPRRFDFEEIGRK